MTISELKAAAYDHIVRINQSQAILQQIDAQIRQMEANEQFSKLPAEVPVAEEAVPAEEEVKAEEVAA